MADKNEQKPAKKEGYTLPWQTAERALEHYRGDKIVREFKAGKTAAVITEDKWGNKNPLIIEFKEGNAPLTVTTEGVFIGRQEIKPGQKPDAKFFPEKTFPRLNLAVLAKGERVDIRYMPITDQNARRDFDADYNRELLFGGKEAHVRDDRGIPARYVVGKDQTLVLTMPLPESVPNVTNPEDDDEIKRPQPAKPGNIMLRGEYYPHRKTGVIGEFSPEQNYIRLPDGSSVAMQPGGRLKLNYLIGSRPIEVLDFKAPGNAQFDRAAEAKRIIEDSPRAIAEAEKQIDRNKIQMFAKVETAFKTAQENYKKINADPAKSQEEKEAAFQAEQTAKRTYEKAQIDYYDTMEPVHKVKRRLDEAERQPFQPQGDLAKTFEKGVAQIREAIAKREHDRTIGTAKTNEVMASMVDAFNGNQRPTLVAATYIRATEDTVIAIAGDQVVKDPEKIQAMNMRAAIKRGAIAVAQEPAPIGGDDITNSVLAIDNKDSKKVTLRIAGDGREVKLDKPLHIVARGPLHVNLSHGYSDNYTGQPLTIRSIGEKGKTSITVEVDKHIEHAFFQPGDALNRNNRYLEGLIADKQGNVTGFQVGANGPVIHVEPGQELLLKVNGVSVKGRANPFAAKDSIFKYPAHEFKITGGINKGKAIESLEEQYKKEESAKPAKEYEVPDKVPQENLGFLLSPSRGPRGV